MKHITIWLTTLTALGLLALQPVLAGNLSCGSYIILDNSRNPTTKYEVLKKCGEPKYRQGDTWVYERGGAAHMVTCNNGLVNTITRGRR